MHDRLARNNTTRPRAASPRASTAEPATGARPLAAIDDLEASLRAPDAQREALARSVGDVRRAVVQLRAESEREVDVATTARAGVGGASGPLPFRERIQASFGRHDVSGVRAHTGGAADRASAELGALGFTMGESVAFRGAPSLFTAAHEAAHVVQQRGGVRLKDGVGRRGDVYERHADEVASLVERGASAESLLDRFAGGRGPAAGGGPVQLREEPLPTSDQAIVSTSQEPTLAEVNAARTAPASAPPATDAPATATTTSGPGEATQAMAAPTPTGPLPDEAERVRAAYQGGLHGVEPLTNMIFYARHPDRMVDGTPRPIRTDEPMLAREWTSIRDEVVKPIVAELSTASAPAPAPPPATAPAAPVTEAPAAPGAAPTPPSSFDAAAFIRPFASFLPFGGTYVSLDEVGLGAALIALIGQPDHISQVIAALAWGDRDEVAFELVKRLPDTAIAALDPALRADLAAQLTGGVQTPEEKAQADRLQATTAPDTSEPTLEQAVTAPAPAPEASMADAERQRLADAGIKDNLDVAIAIADDQGFNVPHSDEVQTGQSAGTRRKNIMGKKTGEIGSLKCSEFTNYTLAMAGWDLATEYVDKASGLPVCYEDPGTKVTFVTIFMVVNLQPEATGAILEAQRGQARRVAAGSDEAKALENSVNNMDITKKLGAPGTRTKDFWISGATTYHDVASQEGQAFGAGAAAVGLGGEVVQPGDRRPGDLQQSMAQSGSKLSAAAGHSSQIYAVRGHGICWLGDPNGPKVVGAVASPGPIESLTPGWYEITDPKLWWEIGPSTTPDRVATFTVDKMALVDSNTGRGGDAVAIDKNKDGSLAFLRPDSSMAYSIGRLPSSKWMGRGPKTVTALGRLSST